MYGCAAASAITAASAARRNAQRCLLRQPLDGRCITISGSLLSEEHRRRDGSSTHFSVGRGGRRLVAVEKSTTLSKEGHAQRFIASCIACVRSRWGSLLRWLQYRCALVVRALTKTDPQRKPEASAHLARSSRAALLLGARCGGPQTLRAGAAPSGVLRRSLSLERRCVAGALGAWRAVAVLTSCVCSFAHERFVLLGVRSRLRALFSRTHVLLLGL